MTCVRKSLKISQLNSICCLLGWLITVLPTAEENSRLWRAHTTSFPLHFPAWFLLIVIYSLRWHFINYKVRLWWVMATVKTSGGQWLIVNPKGSHVVGGIRFNFDSHFTLSCCHLEHTNTHACTRTHARAHAHSYRTLFGLHILWLDIIHRSRPRLQKVCIATLYYLAYLRHFQ